MITVDEIINMRLNEDRTYMVQTGFSDFPIRKLCKIFTQTEFCIIFYQCSETKYSKICVNKVDYYLNHRIIKEVRQ